jgi:hypothetical protein
MRHKIPLQEVIDVVRAFRPDQDEAVYAEWLRLGDAVRAVHFTWGPDVILVVDLVAPAIWVRSRLPAEELGVFLALSSKLKERFMPYLPNPPSGFTKQPAEGIPGPPYCTTEEHHGQAET